MKTILILFLFILSAANLKAQSDREEIEKACIGYIEGFYEGDTTKLINVLKPELFKFGYWKNKTTGQYAPDGQMTYRQALDYAKRVADKKNFAKPGSPKNVIVLDISNTTAAAKVTAWWGTDYMLLAKLNGKWQIEQVLWEGPLDKK